MSYGVIPLNEAVKQWEKQDIIELLASISAKNRWEKSEATHVLEKALVKEWKRRGYRKKVPKVLADAQMVLTKSVD
jgi:hypothetical protein